MTAKTERIIGSTQSIEEGGIGLRFSVKSIRPKPGLEDETIPAFIIKYDASFHAYLNRCGHIAVQLDFQAGEFFTDDGQTLMCATHGAEYAPDTGACLGGPCYGVGLEPIAISVVDEGIVLKDDRYVLVD
jgi:nitrite reductase/ring-hydroxylating ferredoxin subunit